MPKRAASASSQEPASKKHKALPNPYSHSVVSYIALTKAAEAVEFYGKAFNAKKLYDMPMPDGTIAHGEFKIGDTTILYSDSSAGGHTKDPVALKGASSSLCIYCDDVDSLFEQAIKAGCTQLRAVEDHFYGDRAGTLQDPYGHIWSIATHFKDVTPDEMIAIMAKMMAPKSDDAKMEETAKSSPKSSPKKASPKSSPKSSPKKAASPKSSPKKASSSPKSSPKKSSPKASPKKK